MFNRLGRLLRSRGQMPPIQPARPQDGFLEEVFRSAGIKRVQAPGPAQHQGDLTQSQFGAFECVYAVLRERMVRGATGLAPHFAEFEKKAIDQLGAGGWVAADDPSAEASLAARATFSLLAEKRVVIPRVLKDPEMKTIRHTHGELRAALRREDAGEAVTTGFVRRWHFSHSDCADAFAHLYWRNNSGAQHVFQHPSWVRDKFCRGGDAGNVE